MLQKGAQNLSELGNTHYKRSRATGLCEGNSPVTGEFPNQRASKVEIFPFDDVIMRNIDSRALSQLESVLISELS